MDTTATSAEFANAALSAREAIVLLALSAAAMVLSSLDQCTRGPSLTGMLLANLRWIC